MPKRCKGCGEEKALSEFTGRCAHCKVCRRPIAAAAQRRYTATPEGRAKKQAYNNSEAAKTSKRAWCARNRERLREKAKNLAGTACRKAILARYNASKKAKANQERFLGRHGIERRRQYRRTFRSSEYGKRSRVQEQAKRRARMSTGPNDFTVRQWEAIKACYGYSCAYCGESPRCLEQDHVVPVASGGVHSLTNIVPVCRACNASKSDRTLEEFLSELDVTVTGWRSEHEEHLSYLKSTGAAA